MISNRTEYRTEQAGWNMMINNEGILVDGGILPRRAGYGSERTLRGEDVAFLQEYVYCLYKYVTGFYPFYRTTLGDEVMDLPSAYASEGGDASIRADRMNRLMAGMRELAGSGLFLKSELNSIQTGYSVAAASLDGNGRVVTTLGPARDLVSKLGSQLVTESDMDPGMKDVKPGDAVRLDQTRALFASAAKLRFPVCIGYGGTSTSKYVLDAAGAGAVTVSVPRSVSYKQSSVDLEVRWIGGFMDGQVDPAVSSPGSTTVPEAGPVSFTKTSDLGDAAYALPVRGLGAETGDRVVFVAQAVASWTCTRPRTVNDTSAPGYEKSAKLVTITGVGTAVRESDFGFRVESDALYPPKILDAAYGRPVESSFPEPPDGADQVQTATYRDGSTFCSPPNGHVGGGSFEGGVTFIRIAIAGVVSDDIDFEKAYPGWESRLSGK